MSTVRAPGHGDGTPTVGGTGIRVDDVPVAYEHSGYGLAVIIRLCPDLSLGDT